MEPERIDGTVRLERLRKPPKIEFRDVSFHYPTSEINIFEHLNLIIDSGEKIAIVGHNGAGKTTLIKLIAGIYQIQAGEILINGINIKDLKLDDWHKNMGVLFQDFNFYGFLTAEENIFIGRSRKNLNKLKIKKAADNADALEFINEFPNGFDQILGERFQGGIRPSTGQQQKIAIARFFYRNAPMAIFDEPTAAIDAVSEYKIFNKIYRFFKNKTVVIVSHRFSTVRNADRIIVMDHGKIVEAGTHETLMNHDHVYAHAFKLQAEGYQS
jgi:ATP-binding cassette subfamily B protein